MVAAWNRALQVFRESRGPVGQRVGSRPLRPHRPRWEEVPFVAEAFVNHRCQFIFVAEARARRPGRRAAGELIVASARPRSSAVTNRAIPPPAGAGGDCDGLA